MPLTSFITRPLLRCLTFSWLVITCVAGPGGDLRVYLEGLAASENVQKYVEQHPFGQSPINEQNRRWEFYDSVLKRIQSVQL